MTQVVCRLCLLRGCACTLTELQYSEEYAHTGLLAGAHAGVIITTIQGRPDLQLLSNNRCCSTLLLWQSHEWLMQVPSLFTAAQQESMYQDPAAQKVHIEDFEFTELNFVKSSRMSKRWLLFSCFIQVR